MFLSMKQKINKLYNYLLFPYLFIVFFLILIPMLIIVFFSFQEFNEHNFLKTTFTLKYYKDFYKNISFLYVLFRTLSVTIIATFLLVLICYPLAYIVSRFDLLVQSILVLLINGHIWINMILKTQSLVQIFSLIEKFLKIRLLETNIAMFIGFVYLFLPYMFLSIYLSIVKIDKSLIDAAKDLGANEKQIFQKIIFPLSLPGLVTGVALVFLQIVTNIVVPKYLGPTTVVVISELIENKIFLNGDVKSACAMAVNLIFILFFILAFCKNKKYKGSKTYVS
ncbi:spermidine/putrescine ABC transporter permease [Candidatus Phytoplasma phoenicium]|uniref:Spermidine/putrescine ABC transporter permease n=1 Tax=Candidatus Phytoplasma phoenicium TaxID=198422 RepID=A0A2S8NVF3_9MOLU|nr:spermidine/putrescine ABC transporter permease [Candidatus Phytoplasma phoenicium]